MNPDFAFEGEIQKFHVFHRRPEIMGQNAARNHERQWRVEFSKRLGYGGKAVRSWKVADPLNTNSRTAWWRPASRRLSINQNVAGLWLLYGYSSKLLKIGTFPAPRDSSARCDDLLTSRVDNDPGAGL
jgi:hypothetical protein